jgi:uncharacterized protein (TIGR02271 family)
VTRSEEELRVGTERRPRERVRLRKYVVTEEVPIVVPVRREEVRIERVAAGEEDADAIPAEEAAEAAREVVLHEERPVVSTEVVPTERVRLVKDVVSGEEEVGGVVRRERVEVEGDDPR